MAASPMPLDKEIRNMTEGEPLYKALEPVGPRPRLFRLKAVETHGYCSRS
jgi:hypothetical protein